MNWIISLFSLYECSLLCSAMGVIGRQCDMWPPLCQKQWDCCDDGYKLAIKMHSAGRATREAGRQGREKAMQRNVISPPVAEAMGLVPSLCAWPSWPIVDDSNSPRTQGRLQSTVKLPCECGLDEHISLISSFSQNNAHNNGSRLRLNNCYVFELSEPGNCSTIPYSGLIEISGTVD